MEFFASSMASAGEPPRERPPRLSPDSSPFGSDILISPGDQAHTFFPVADTPAIPNFGLGPVFGYASVWNVASKTYSWRWDEAYRRSRQDAIAMTRDCWLMSMLNERAFPTSQRPWNLVPEDPDRPEQVEVAKYLTKCIEAPGNFETMAYDLTKWMLWFGRSGIQVVWGTEPIMGRDTWTVQDYSPVNGDKIQFSWDGIPELMVYTPALTELQNRHPGTEIRYTDRSKVLVLSTPYWRDRFLIGKGDRVDSDFYESDMAGGLHGVGIRHWIYWLDWMRKELSSYVFDFMERVGLGFTVYYYEAGNQKAQAEAINLAQGQGRNTWIVWPREPGETGAAKGVERVESNASGASFLKELCEYFDTKIERFIIGQSMSSGKDNQDGLGGSGRANFAKDTKRQLLRSDEVKVESCLTRDYVRVLQRYNCPQAKFNIRFKFASETPNQKEQLEVAKNGYEMGVALDEDQVRDWIGARKPKEGVRLLQKPEAQQADQQAALERQQAQAKLDMSQQAAQQKLETQKQLSEHKLSVAEQQAELKQQQQLKQHEAKLQAAAQQQQQRQELGAQSHAAKLDHLQAVNRLKQQQLTAGYRNGSAQQISPPQPLDSPSGAQPEVAFAGEDPTDTFFGLDDPEPSAQQEPQPPQQNEADKQKDQLLRAQAEGEQVRYSWEARAKAAGLDPRVLTMLADDILQVVQQ